MADNIRDTALDQSLDIAGSLNRNQTQTAADEASGLGARIQSGSSASITAVAVGIATITGLSGITDASLERFITISGASTAANNGTFLIVAVLSATSVQYSNSLAVAGDSNNGSIAWIE